MPMSKSRIDELIPAPEAASSAEVAGLLEEVALLRELADMARDAVEQVETIRVMRQQTANAIKAATKKRSELR